MSAPRRCLLATSSVIRAECPRSTASPRCFSTGASRRDSPAKGYAHLQTRRLIELRGPQAAQFLQGLTTANITSDTPESSTAIYSAFLNAQGRLLQDVFIYPLAVDSNLVPASGKEASVNEQTFLIEVDSLQSAALFRWLRKYKLRAKVAIREIDPEEIAIFSAWNDAKTTTELIQDTANIDSRSAMVTPDSRLAKLGLRILSRRDSPVSNDLKGIYGDSGKGELHYRVRRYLHGVPEGQSELSYETALVHDSNIDHLHGVDFRKGCYVGQELVIRTQHTGVVRKRILPCMLYEDSSGPPSSLEWDGSESDLIASGSDIVAAPIEEGRKARSKGKWLTGVGNLGLALCRLEDMVGIGPAGDRLEGYEEKQWTFVGSADGAKRLRLKAFVPEWLQQEADQDKI